MMASRGWSEIIAASLAPNQRANRMNRKVTTANAYFLAA
jgi:hypothetical protein